MDTGGGVTEEGKYTDEMVPAPALEITAVKIATQAVREFISKVERDA